MPEYIIYCSLDTKDSGGAKALYELGLTLRSLGQEAYVVPGSLSIPPLYESKIVINNVPVAPPNIIDLESEIIIYPEVVTGNPRRANNVVRWILCTLGKAGADRSPSWGKHDLWMHWGDFTSGTDQPLRQDEIMFVFGLEERWLGGEPQESRLATYYLTRKARHFHQSVQQLHPNDAIHLDKICSDTNDYLAHYKKGRLLVCYDPYSFHATLAALSGCLTVVYSLPGISREEWVRQGPAYAYLPKVNNSPFMPGIAYGVEEINLARQTSQLLWPTLQKLNEAVRQSVQRFVEKSKLYFQASPQPSC